MKTRISKAYRGKEHIGWRKTVGGRDWFLGYGTSPADEAKAIALAEIIEAKLRLIRAAGGTELSQTDFEDAKVLGSGLPRRRDAQEQAMAAATASLLAASPTQVPLPPPPQTVPVIACCVVDRAAAPDVVPRRWLFASLDEFIATVRRSLKPDGSNGDHVINTIERVLRARDAIKDMPLDLLRRKELDDWLLDIRSLPSKLTGQPLRPVTVRNLVTAVRAALTKICRVGMVAATAALGESVQRVFDQEDGDAGRAEASQEEAAVTLDR